MQQLGLSEKEACVYLALLELGTQPASVIARKTAYPKATVLFLFANLLKLGYIRKSQRGRIQYFFADPKDLLQAKTKLLQEQQEALKKTIPLLQEFKNPFSSQPKMTFFEGLENCRKAYEMLLESKTEILEFGAHNDLLKFGEKFMNNFIRERVRRKILIRDICQSNPLHRSFMPLNKKQNRITKLFPKALGEIYSSIAIFENKVLLLNLHQDPFAILIENPAVAETLKTIHRLAWR